jgi:antitoxin (DNA-binding transcriptional repressor) of toxin-antitoxin stability system
MLNWLKMKTISVRDLRQKWPEAERALKVESEIVITRDGKPVARLTLYEERPKKRRRFDPAKHGQWQRRQVKGKTVSWVTEFLISERSRDREE